MLAPKTGLLHPGRDQMSEKSILVQDSNYWDTWQSSKQYSLQVNIFNAIIDAEPTSALKTNPVDTYVVVFLSKDRANSKKKTSICKKCLTPSWMECVVFTGLELSERITVELKMPSWGSLNPVLASYTFSMSDIVNATHGDRKSKIYPLTPNFQGVTFAHVGLGFSFNPPVSGKMAEEFSGDMPVSLNASGAFTSLLFTNVSSSSGDGGVILNAPPQRGGSIGASKGGGTGAMKLFNSPAFETVKK